MIIYEVNVEVNAAIFDEYLVWLKPHIKELLAIDGFIKADVLFDNYTEQEGIRKITVAYQLKDYDSYQNYINTHASQMREEAVKRFQGQFSASRRVLELEGTYFL